MCVISSIVHIHVLLLEYVSTSLSYTNILIATTRRVRSQYSTAGGDRSNHCRSVAPWPNQMDRQTDRRTDGRTDIQTDRQTDRYAGRQTDKQTDRQSVRSIVAPDQSHDELLRPTTDSTISRGTKRYPHNKFCLQIVTSVTFIPFLKIHNYIINHPNSKLLGNYVDRDM